MEKLKSFIHLHKIFTVFVIAIILGITLGFYSYWRMGYSSDTALIGLMAKSILERGDRPIFVWSVGYQGILLEAYATAWIFKVLGINAFTLNFFNMVCLWSVFAIYYYYLRYFFDYWIALLATLFLAMSTPAFYTTAMRTQPNYTETYLFGLVLFWISHLLIRHFYVERKPPQFKTNVYFAAFGFVAGFAIYTYGQISYFLGAIGLQGLLIYLRDIFQQGKHAWSGLLRWKAVQWIAWFSILHFIFAFVYFMIDKQDVTLFGVRISFNSPAMVQVSLGIFSILACVDVMQRYGSQLRRFWKEALLFTGGVLLGYSPKLYFIFVRHGRVADRMTINGTLTDVIHRLSFVLKGDLEFLNIPSNPFLKWVSILVLSLCLIGYCSFFLKKSWEFILAKSSHAKILELSPIGFLPWIVLPVFAIASAVTDLASARYTLVLWFFYALALSWTLVTLLRNKGINKGLGFAVLLLVLWNNSSTFYGAFKNKGLMPFYGEAALAALQERGIRFGYSDYWLAYTINFFTNEKIVFEPLSSNYSPFYGPMVMKEARIGYLDTDPPKLVPVDNKLMINGMNYRVQDQWREHGLNLFTLEKIL